MKKTFYAFLLVFVIGLTTRVFADPATESKTPPVKPEIKKAKPKKEAAHQHRHDETNEKHDDHGDHAKSAKHDDHKAHEKSEKHDDHADHGKSGKLDDHAGHDDHEESEKHDDHGSSDKHDDHGGHGGHGEEEGGSKIGPGKGIVSASEKDGFKLSDQALKNFDVKYIDLSGSGPWVVPDKSQVRSGEEINLYRVRDGLFKRIDLKSTQKSKDQISVSSRDLKAGDRIVIQGQGFLRIAEITAFGGAPEGHSH